MVLVPPFGWDEQCSYRARRHLADALAARGTTVLRLDLPGTGDSAGGPWDPGRLEAWTRSVAAAADLLRGRGQARVAAVGFGLGALLAVRAAELGAAIDDLALWGLPASGRAFVRELKALSRLETGLGLDPELAAGAIAAAGYVLSAETASALTALTAAGCLPAAAGRRLLVLDRDGLKTDEGALAGLRASAELQRGRGAGWGAMLREPQFSVLPETTFKAICDWASAPATASSLSPGPPPAWEERLKLAAAVEQHVELAGPRGHLPGILTIPEEPSGLTAVLLNAGPQRRIGPNRMWVEAARRWAPLGVRTLRVDLGGIGDAPPELALGDVGTLYTGDHVAEVRAVLAALRGTEGPRFVVAGLCSGAVWALCAAVEEPDVAAVVLLNPRTLIWRQEHAELRDARLFARQLLLRSSWRKVLRGQVNWRRPPRLARTVVRALARRLRGGSALAQGIVRDDPVAALLAALPNRGSRVTVLFAGHEEFRDSLVRSGYLDQLAASPYGTVLEVGDPAIDTHTLRPTLLQREAGRVLDAEVSRAVANAPP